MIPIGHERSLRNARPAIVYLLVGINIIVFVYEMYAGTTFITGYAAVPFEITTGVDIMRPIYLPGGELMPHAPGPKPIYLTLLTSMFMHGGLLHIVSNMLFLWVFGDKIEENFGHWRFIAFYLLCGLIASLAHILFEPQALIPSLGASGAIAGVLGAYIMLYPHEEIRVLLPLGFFFTIIRLPAFLVIGSWIILQFFNQFAAIIETTAQTRGDNVAYMAHIGGFLAGLLLSLLFYRKQRPQPRNNYQF